MILATGEKVVMEDSLEKAINALTGFEEITQSGVSKEAQVERQDGGVIQNEFESIKDTINQLNESLTILEKALERLGDLTGEGE